MANTFFNKRNFAFNKTNSVPSLQFKLVGNWDKVIKTVQSVSPAVKKAGIYAQIKICEKVKQRVQYHLANQDLGWKAISPKTAKKKASKNLDSRTLIAYGQYYYAIEVWRPGSQHIVNVGVKRGRYTFTLSGKRSRIDIAKIATIHEFSSGKRVPRRPLWNPTIAEIGGAEGIKKLYLKHLIGKLRVMGIPIKPFRNIWL